MDEKLVSQLPLLDNATLYAVAQVREYMEKLIESNDKRYELRDQYQQEALRLALEANNRRLDTMNEFRAALTDQSTRMISRTESDVARIALSDKTDDAFTVLNTRIDGEIRPLHAKLGEMGKPNWALLGSAISILFVLIAGIYTIIGLKIDASMSPLAAEITQFKVATATLAETVRVHGTAIASSTQSDLESRSDRNQLNGRLQTVEGLTATGNADRRSATATINAQLVEIETQFKSLSHAHNEQNDQTQRIQGLLWQRVYNETLPKTEYRPNYFREIN